MFKDQIPDKLIPERVYSGEKIEGYIAEGNNRILLTDDVFKAHGNYVVSTVLEKQILSSNQNGVDYGNRRKKEVIIATSV